MNFAPRLLSLVGTLLVGSLALSLGLVSSAQAAYGDPPGRVARLSDSRGDVSYSPAGENDWLYSVRNRPIIRGDRLWSSRGARAELQVGSAAIRLGQNTGLEVLELSDQLVQLRMTQGALNLRVRRLYRGQSLEIATPTLAFVIDRPGNYRIDVDARRDVTTVVVWNGRGQAYGANSRFSLRAGDAVRFYSADLRDYQSYGLPRPDAFDRYCTLRDERFERSASLRYVDDDLIGYTDLDQYGSWSANRDYGNIWFPTQVRANWAPYRDGHWVWQEPWGWTWVDDAAWGFAPSHYGRWVFLSNRWGWIPGPRNTRSVYAPALVAFVGGRAWSASISFGGGSRIGWFPLGPREAYLPSYQASRAYFTQINVNNTVINTTTITNVYNNYSSGRIDVAQSNYRNRSVPGALTAVSNDVFVNAKPVREAQLQLDASASRGGEIMQLVAVAPSEQSIFGIAPQASAKPEQATFSREVIAHSKPAPEIAAFSERVQQLQRDPGKAVDPVTSRGAIAPINVRVVTPAAAAIDARELGSRRSDEKLSAPAGKPAELTPLDRSAVPEASLLPEVVGSQRDDAARQQQIQRKEEQRQQNADAQNKLDEQARQQEAQRKETQRQQNANAQNKLDEQARQQEAQRKETERQQNANAQNKLDEQARQQEAQRKETQRQQNANAQNKLDEQARQQEAQRKETERQQNANAQNKRDEQARQQEAQRKEVERQQNVNAQNKLDEQAREQEAQRKEAERQQNVNAQNKLDEQAREQEAQRKEAERQQNANAQNKRDEQAREQEAQRQELERQQNVDAQTKLDGQARQQGEQPPQEQLTPTEDAKPNKANSRKNRGTEDDEGEKD